MKTRDITIAAVFAALTFVITLYIQIPIPLGYFNIGNTVILLACLLLPLPYGILVGSLGSALADLLSFPVYTIPTLIIKALFPLVFYLIAGKNKNSNIRLIIAAAISTLIPLFGYTIVGGILYGGFAAGLAQFPGLLVEYAANLALFALLMTPIKRIGKVV